MTTACTYCQRIPTCAQAEAVVLVVRTDKSTSCAWCWSGETQKREREGKAK